MASWPGFLPYPLQNGYAITQDEPILRTQMDAGPGRTRRRFTTSPARIPVKWRLTGAQLALFEAWHKLEALDGASWFSVSLINGLGVNQVDARFTAPPKKALVGGSVWEVQSELEVRELPVMTQAYLEAALAYGPDEIIYGSPVLHTLIHTTLPQANYWSRT